MIDGGSLTNDCGWFHDLTMLLKILDAAYIFQAEPSPVIPDSGSKGWILIKASHGDIVV